MPQAGAALLVELADRAGLTGALSEALAELVADRLVALPVG
ncbi:MAG: hypothetical protein ACRDMX_07970 [Solirubrobacteraceae bacterium]